MRRLLAVLYPACAGVIIFPSPSYSVCIIKAKQHGGVSVGFNARNLLHGNVLLSVLMTDANQQQPSPTRTHSPLRDSCQRCMITGDTVTVSPPPPFANAPLICTGRASAGHGGARHDGLLHGLCENSPYQYLSWLRGGSAEQLFPACDDSYYS